MRWCRMILLMGGPMNLFLLALSYGSAGVTLWWALKLRKRKNQIQKKYAPIADIDSYIRGEEERILKYEQDELRKIDEERRRMLDAMDAERLEIDGQISTAKSELQLLEQNVKIALEKRDEILRMKYDMTLFIIS